MKVEQFVRAQDWFACIRDLGDCEDKGFLSVRLKSLGDGGEEPREWSGALDACARADLWLMLGDAIGRETFEGVWSGEVWREVLTVRLREICDDYCELARTESVGALSGMNLEIEEGSLVWEYDSIASLLE